MTKYGFDLDGTLDRTVLRQLATDLHEAGHEIHVLTGAMEDIGEWTAQARREKIDGLGLPWIPDERIHRCFGKSLEEIGREKGRALDRLGIKLMLDDSPTFVREMTNESNALILYVVNNPKKML